MCPCLSLEAPDTQSGLTIVVCRTTCWVTSDRSTYWLASWTDVQNLCNACRSRLQDTTSTFSSTARSQYLLPSDFPKESMVLAIELAYSCGHSTPLDDAWPPLAHQRYCAQVCCAGAHAQIEAPLIWAGLLHQVYVSASSMGDPSGLCSSCNPTGRIKCHMTCPQFAHLPAQGLSMVHIHQQGTCWPQLIRRGCAPVATLWRLINCACRDT